MYRVSATDRTTGQITVGSDELVLVDGATGTLNASDESVGFMTRLFDDATVSFENERLVINGSIPLPIEGLEGFTLDFENIGLYDTSLEEFSNFLNRSLKEDIQVINGNTIRVAYVIQTLNDDPLDVFSFNLIDENFERPGNFLQATISIGLSVAVESIIDGEFALIPIIPFREVFFIKNTFAADLGLIESIVETQYTINDLSDFDITLPFTPRTESIIATQEISGFDVN